MSDTSQISMVRSPEESFGGICYSSRRLLRLSAKRKNTAASNRYMIFPVKKPRMTQITAAAAYMATGILFISILLFYASPLEIHSQNHQKPGKNMILVRTSIKLPQKDHRLLRRQVYKAIMPRNTAKQKQASEK